MICGPPSPIPAVSRWLGEVEGDLRQGGEFRARYFASGWEGTGYVEVCEPPQRLLILTRSPDEPDGVIEVTLTTDGDQTILVIEDRGLPLEQIAAYGAGDQIHVEDLAAYLAGRARCDARARCKNTPPRLSTACCRYHLARRGGGISYAAAAVSVSQGKARRSIPYVAVQLRGARGPPIHGEPQERAPSKHGQREKQHRDDKEARRDAAAGDDAQQHAEQIGRGKNHHPFGPRTPSPPLAHQHASVPDHDGYREGPHDGKNHPVGAARLVRVLARDREDQHAHEISEEWWQPIRGMSWRLRSHDIENRRWPPAPNYRGGRAPLG